MTARKTPLARNTVVTVQVSLSAAEAEAFVGSVFTCTSVTGWREAERALTTVRHAVAERLAAGQ